MKSMKKLLSGETTPPILECGEAQFQAAFTMEARSRTPLPPSPTTQPLQESMISSFSQMSTDLDHKLKMKSLVSDFSGSIKSKLPVEKPLPNPKPSKPPRKYTPVTASTDDPHYEPVDRSYDEVEYRNNAWQTMGIDSPDHTEQVNIVSFFI